MTITNGIVKINLSTSSPYAVTYAWTVIQTGTVTGATSGTGNSINQQVTGIGTLTYTVTATETATGCSGEPIDIVITVQEDGLIGNEYRSEIFYSEDCEFGEVAQAYLYEVPAYTYFAETLEEANDLALEAINAHGQEDANTYGECTGAGEDDLFLNLHPTTAGSTVTINVQLKDVSNAPATCGVDILVQAQIQLTEISTGDPITVVPFATLLAGTSSVYIYDYDTTAYTFVDNFIMSAVPDPADGHNLIY